MGEALRRRIKQDRFPSSAVEAMFNLVIATDFVRQYVEETVSRYGLSAAQYNVLRILRGAYPNGYPRCEIITRMLERAPDVTRLVDRLEKAGFVLRDKSAQDRRWSITRITEKGLKLLNDMRPAVEAVDQILAQRLSDSECQILSMICEKLYGDENADDPVLSVEIEEEIKE